MALAFLVVIILLFFLPFILIAKVVKLLLKRGFVVNTISLMLSIILFLLLSLMTYGLLTVSDDYLVCDINSDICTLNYKKSSTDDSYSQKTFKISDIDGYGVKSSFYHTASKYSVAKDFCEPYLILKNGRKSELSYGFLYTARRGKCEAAFAKSYRKILSGTKEKIESGNWILRRIPFLGGTMLLLIVFCFAARRSVRRDLKISRESYSPESFEELQKLLQK